MPDGTIVSFILYARDGTFRVLKMVDDDHSEFGSFCVLDAAVRTIAATADTGKVRLGGCAPSLATADTGKVRLGGCAPSLATAGAGKVRLGGCAPSLATADAGKVRLAR